MKRIVLVFGVISGLIASSLMLSSMALERRGIIKFDNAEWFGYTALFLAFLLVFFGIRAYRDNQGGSITFGRAFTVGILITLISSVFYVATWEILYFNTRMHEYGKTYEAATIASMRAKGASDATIAAKKKDLDRMMQLYENPIFNSAITFLEPLPVGLIMTLVSAGILRRRDRSAPPRAATEAV